MDPHDAPRIDSAPPSLVHLTDPCYKHYPVLHNHRDRCFYPRLCAPTVCVPAEPSRLSLTAHTSLHPSSVDRTVLVAGYLLISCGRGRRKQAFEMQVKHVRTPGLRIACTLRNGGRTESTHLRCGRWSHPKKSRPPARPAKVDLVDGWWKRQSRWSCRHRRQPPSIAGCPPPRRLPLTGFAVERPACTVGVWDLA